ncbi:hypothetical protein NEMBOFW57_002086 [Staphylotrichum longicolle]|uniref:SGNH hydrolase-type esterase domain-containing protein n=1 Tax=Staphylotrichum longicolle TaxID=669026 RepID=A0AAD4F3L0_9PEZI|nr:hypothetical protein NEMBOFW57_002086 [Staphylotrichum longicolle]
MGFPPEAIYESLKEVWAVPLSHNCKVLALTVPEAGIKGTVKARIDAKRNTLNDLIRNHKAENFHVYDLNKHVTYWSMSEADRAKYWDDHIHFTPDGYDLIGNKVGVALKRRRLFRGDDKAFDEEAGDPTAIDQGYVVVRRADLE